MINLYEHQQYAVEHLRNGSVLCGRVGSGKSRAALAYYFFKVCEGIAEPDEIPTMKKPRDLYIITTARKRDTFEWEGDCIPFCLSIHPENDIFGVKVIVDSWNNIKKYSDVYGAFFIFDEQHLVGSGAWVKAFYKIANKNQWIVLSATPGDDWKDYIPLFVANGFYKNKTEFCREHVIYSNYAKYPKVERYIGCRKLARLKDSIVVYMDYQNPTIPHQVYFELGYDRELYRRVTKTRWNPFTDAPIAQASEYAHTLRKISNMSEFRIAQTKTLIDENPRLIIFYNFDYELEILRNVCKEKEVIFSEWNGHKHESVPETECWVYLIQYNAGAEGFNCIATNTILFYSFNYSYKSMVQAAGRIDRINTPYRDLYYYYLYTEAPIDRMILRCLREKKDFNERRYVSF